MQKLISYYPFPDPSFVLIKWFGVVDWSLVIVLNIIFNKIILYLRIHSLPIDEAKHVVHPRIS